jgi:hypothetical protein
MHKEAAARPAFIQSTKRQREVSQSEELSNENNLA